MLLGGAVGDRSALHGVLGRIEALELLELRRLPPSPETGRSTRSELARTAVGAGAVPVHGSQWWVCC
jgi:hypothetical protein